MSSQPFTFGQGPPVFVASGVYAPTSSKPNAPLKPLDLAVGVSPGSAQNGQAVVNEVNAAVFLPMPKRLSRLGLLVYLFPRVTLRVLAFHEVMNDLARRGEDKIIDRILGDKKRRGRPRQQPFHLIAVIEVVMREHEHEGFCIADAVRWIKENHGDHRTVRSMKNHYTSWGPYYEMWRRPIFVPGELLANDHWRRPNEEPPLIPWHLLPAFHFVSP